MDVWIPGLRISNGQWSAPTCQPPTTARVMVIIIIKDKVERSIKLASSYSRNQDSLVSLGQQTPYPNSHYTPRNVSIF